MRIMVATALLAVVTAAAASGETAEQKAFRIAKNGEVVFKNYPPRALKAGEQGMVGFLITLDRDGEPTECRVTHTSGHPLLDQETCALIASYGVFKPVRDGNGKLVRVARSQGYVNWQLPGQSRPGSATQIAANNAPDKMICRRIERTGSLVAKDRICRTAREWSRTQSEQRNQVEAVQGIQGSTNGTPPTAELGCPAGGC